MRTITYKEAHISAQELEYLRIGVSALTPIVTGVVGVLILRLGSRIEHAKNLHRELLKKRLELFDDIAPKINDVYCFFQAVGHWSELSPEQIIVRKRDIDRALHVNRFLFDENVWVAYQQFENLHLEMYSSAGKPAMLRLDLNHVQMRVGQLFKTDWMPSVSKHNGDREAQKQAYQALLDSLGRGIATPQ